jgi:hypothetical protein
MELSFRPSRSLLLLLTLVPFLCLVLTVVKYAVPVPLWDQWQFVPLIEKSFRGELTISDLWAQHNEHRIFFPKLIMLILARLTSWDIRFELAVNLLLGLGIFAVVMYQTRVTARQLGVSGLKLAAPAFSLIVFSLSQYQNWLWGWQLAIFLNVLAVVTATVLLTDPRISWSRFTGAAALALVATFSFGSGFIIWPVGLMILWFAAAGGRERMVRCGAWSVLSVLAISGYFYHYQRQAERTVSGLGVDYALYVCKFLGNSCAQFSETQRWVGVAACVSGAGAVALLVWSGCVLVRGNPRSFKLLLPYCGMALYSIGTALLTGIARASLGSDQALASRYCTLTVPFWVALTVFLTLLISSGAASKEFAALAPDGVDLRDSELAPRQIRPDKPTAASVHFNHSVAEWSLVAFLALLIASSIFATGGAKGMSERQASGRKCLLDLAAKPGDEIDKWGLAALFPKAAVVVQQYPTLTRYHLSLFRVNGALSNTGASKAKATGAHQEGHKPRDPDV